VQTSQLGITYSGPAAVAPLDLLQIEQEEWSRYTGKVTKLQMVKHVSSLLSGSAYESAIDCGMVDGAVTCAVYVYPLLSVG